MPPKAQLHPRRRWQGIFLDDDEEVVTVIHRHPIGIILIILVGLIAIIAMVVVLIQLLPDAFTNSSTQSSAVAAAFVIISLVTLFVLIAIYIYRQSRLLVTNKNLAQIVQRTLFSRKVSELSMSNVEDVSVEQQGILATIFNYGTLVVQTAGEMENFIFKLCPNPNKFSEMILEARQAYAESLEEEMAEMGRVIR